MWFVLVKMIFVNTKQFMRFEVNLTPTFCPKIKTFQLAISLLQSVSGFTSCLLLAAGLG